jgi:hypothetical protein
MVFEETATQYALTGMHRYMTAEQIARAATVHIDRPSVRSVDGRPLEDQSSPVLLIGDSNCRCFEGVLACHLNRGFRSRWTDGASSEAFADFLREPQQLNGVRVVLWVAGWDHLTEPKPLPASILAAVEK